MKTAVAALLALLAWNLSSPARADDPARGKELSTVCQSCHGENGNLALQPEYPLIGGQHFDYLVHALRAYRSGDRENAIMAGFARNLSDQDIRDLAAWYSRQDGSLKP
ncbi:MAG: cytochrome c [Wenzhouxiangella sp.]|jgi:cytochrome c553|nr:cytochrome c [Wenzhouxiangella sp.]